MQVFAQDVIVFRTGDEVKAKVEEVGTSEVKYRKFENPSGPLYTKSKSEIFMIRYQNGDKEVFKDETMVSETKPLHSSSFSINPLGLLQFGPMFQWEIKMGSNYYLVPHFRYGYLGLATHYVATGFEEGSKLSPANFGMGAGIRGFSPKKNSNQNLYYGGILEINIGSASYGIGTPYETKSNFSSMQVMANFGNRWRHDNGRFLNFGLYLGPSFTIKDVEKSVSSGYFYYDEDNNTRFFAMLELSFGWEKNK